MDSCTGGSGIATARGHGGRQCTMRSAYILRIALPLLFSRFISFRVIASFFARPLSPVSTHGYVSTPSLYQIDIGVLLALGRPEYASCRPLFGLPFVVGLPKHCYSYPPCALDYEHGPDVANEALIHVDRSTQTHSSFFRGRSLWLTPAANILEVPDR